MEYHYQVGKAKVTIISNVTDEERKQNLKRIYDVVNEIADRKRLAGENVDHWFYTQAELDEMRRNNDPRLIYWSTKLWIKWTSIERGDETLKDKFELVLMIMILILILIGLAFYHSYRVKEIEIGKLELVYQYGGDI